ncbi:MAG: prolipoprotein diacylglyceryl transferase [Clostridia bacterium]|nr:prolipoprotein diacylglyceryl transferase [Clostridia bacterium]
MRPARRDPGRLMRIYLCAYAGLRFVLEFFRGDELRGVLLLSTSQWISLVIPALCFGLRLRRRKMARAAEDGARPAD